MRSSRCTAPRCPTRSTRPVPGSCTPIACGSTSRPGESGGGGGLTRHGSRQATEVALETEAGRDRDALLPESTTVPLVAAPRDDVGRAEHRRRDGRAGADRLAERDRLRERALGLLAALEAR